MRLKKPTVVRLHGIWENRNQYQDSGQRMLLSLVWIELLYNDISGSLERARRCPTGHKIDDNMSEVKAKWLRGMVTYMYTMDRVCKMLLNDY